MQESARRSGKGREKRKMWAKTTGGNSKRRREKALAGMNQSIKKERMMSCSRRPGKKSRRRPAEYGRLGAARGTHVGAKRTDGMVGSVAKDPA